MKFGIQINRSTESIEEHLKIVELAEQAGFDPILFADGVSTAGVTHRDVYAMLVLWAQRVRNAKIGTCVTNPITRHPAVTANAICTIDEISDGRAILGIGIGDTPVFVLGLQPARLKVLRESIETIRAFCRGDPFELNGRPVQSPWNRGDIPILLAADGPKTLELAGELSDGVIVGSGLHEEVVRWALDRIHDGAKRTERTTPEIWLNGICHIVSDANEGREFIRRRLITRVNHNFRAGIHAVPDVHRQEVERLRAEYDESDVGPTSKNVALITDYLVDRFSITGNVDYAVDRLTRLAEQGVERFMVATHYFKEHRLRTIEAFGHTIIPRLR